MREKTKVLCIGRTLFHLFNKLDALKAGLHKGLQFKFACFDPNAVDDLVRDLTFTKPSDITSALEQLRDLVSWAEKEKPLGSIELRFHRAGMVDTALAFCSETEGETLLWDLSFGRDVQDRKVLVMGVGDNSLGCLLKNRYEAIFEDAESVVRCANGVCAYFKPKLPTGP